MRGEKVESAGAGLNPGARFPRQRPRERRITVIAPPAARWRQIWFRRLNAGSFVRVVQATDWDETQELRFEYRTRTTVHSSWRVHNMPPQAQAAFKPFLDHKLCEEKVKEQKARAAALFCKSPAR